MQKIMVNDEVIVLSGKNKKTTGKVLKILKKQDRVLVQGVNLVKKAIKPSQENPNGGFSESERPIHISNLALLDPKTKGPTRVRFEKKDNGWVRIAVKSNSELPSHK